MQFNGTNNGPKADKESEDNNMRRNNRSKASNLIENFDRVYIEATQCPWLHSMTVLPLKTRYFNGAGIGGRIDHVFYTMEQFENFLDRYRIEV